MIKLIGSSPNKCTTLRPLIGIDRTDDPRVGDELNKGSNNKGEEIDLEEKK